MEKLFNVGKIVNTHGIKGEVRVISVTDFPEERYQKGSVLILEREKAEPIELVVASHRKHKNFDLLTFENHPTIESVEIYRDGILKVTEERLTELPENEFYLHEIVGLRVEDETGNEIGKIKEVLQPGANDVWVIQRHKKKDLLIPYIAECVLNVDLEAGKVTIHLMEGLDD